MLSNVTSRLELIPVLLGLITALLLASAAPASDQPARYVVVLNGTVSDVPTVAADQAQTYGAQVAHVYKSALKGYAATIPANRVEALRADPRVRFVSPDGQANALTGQTLVTGVSRIKALDKANKGTGVNVAVIDTGIDVRHPDLAANIAGGYNCSSGGARNYSDGHGHGTHVAGIIAAVGKSGVVGVAPEAKLWAVRVLNDQGSGSFSDVVCGIDFVDSKSPAKGGPIKVANMSLGGWGADDGNCGNTSGDVLHQAICHAVADGVSFVVAAGNAGVDLSQPTTMVPGAYDEVISATALADVNGAPCGGGGVTSYGADDTFASFSNYATSVADLDHLVGAPGVNIYSTYKGGGYATLSGTSMATPHVAGSAALYVAAHPGASPLAVREALKAVGEPPNVSFNADCSSGTSTGKKQGGQHGSHSDPSGKHPEVVIRDDSF